MQYFELVFGPFGLPRGPFFSVLFLAQYLTLAGFLRDYLTFFIIAVWELDTQFAMVKMSDILQRNLALIHLISRESELALIRNFG